MTSIDLKLVCAHNWSLVCIYERPILGESPKPHFLAKCGFQCGFHEIHWISCLKARNQISEAKNFTSQRGRGGAMSFELCEIINIC